jgi:pilus assembly protein Flp/PilA
MSFVIEPLLARKVFLPRVHRGSDKFPASLLLEGKTMTTLIDAARRFGRDEEGASLAEYGLLIALIAVVCIAAISLLGTNISTMFNSVASTI